MTREWQYWTENKLQILADYLPAFNSASKRAGKTLYIDLMAGEPHNILKNTDRVLDGSVRIAMSANPGFSRLAFCELNPTKANELRRDIDELFPNDGRWTLFEGDCNSRIDGILTSLKPLAWAPTFAFIDQQAAEVNWATLQKLASFRTGKYKAEQWILMSPSFIVRGTHGSDSVGFQSRVDALFGNTDWRNLDFLRERDSLTPEEYRDEMVNLFCWQMQESLGYRHTVRIPMRMTQNRAIYDMVFATDHDAGLNIMTDVYKTAAEREPRMMEEAKASKINQIPGLFAVSGSDLARIDQPKWEHKKPWNPRTRDWWNG